jgi:hypothetical protein
MALYLYHDPDLDQRYLAFTDLTIVVDGDSGLGALDTTPIKVTYDYPTSSVGNQIVDHLVNHSSYNTIIIGSTCDQPSQ